MREETQLKPMTQSTERRIISSRNETGKGTQKKENLNTRDEEPDR